MFIRYFSLDMFDLCTQVLCLMQCYEIDWMVELCKLYRKKPLRHVVLCWWMCSISFWTVPQFTWSWSQIRCSDGDSSRVSICVWLKNKILWIQYDAIHSRGYSVHRDITFVTKLKVSLCALITVNRTFMNTRWVPGWMLNRLMLHHQNKLLCPRLIYSCRLLLSPFFNPGDTNKNKGSLWSWRGWDGCGCAKQIEMKITKLSLANKQKQTKRLHMLL